jgi:hypothetical protein
MGAVLNRSVAKAGVIAYADHKEENLFHYLPAQIEAVPGETLLDFNVTYYGINPKVYYVDTGYYHQDSVVGGLLSGRAKPDITSTQRNAIIEEIKKVFQIEEPNLVPLEITEIKVQPIFAKSIAQMGQESNADFPSIIKFGQTFNYQVSSGNSLFAELVGSERSGGITQATPDFAVNISAMAEFYGDPWEADIEADLKQVWEYTRLKVNANLGLGWLNIGTQIDEISQSLIKENIIKITYREGSGGNEFGRQLLETTKQVFEQINAQITGGEGLFKFEPNPQPQQPKDPDNSWGASLLPWTADINFGYDKNSFSQSILYKNSISFTGKLSVPIAVSMNLALPCNSQNSNLFYDLQTKSTGCITREKSEGLQKRIAKEAKAKNAEILNLRESLVNGKINLETYSTLKGDLNTFSLTESSESIKRPNGKVVYRTLTPEEASSKFAVRLKAAEQEHSKSFVEKVKLYPTGVLGQKVVTCNQVDSTSPDRFLDCCRDHISHSCDHNSVMTAVDGFLKCLPAKKYNDEGIANIYGHGAAGDMNWGGGAGLGNPKTQVVKSSTIKYWSRQVERLRDANINVLVLASCNVGASAVGSQLLWELAQAANCVVMGGTGKLFCGKNGLSWEEGTVFQYGYPNSANPQPPINPPQKFFGVQELKSLNLINQQTGSVESFEVSDIVRLSFAPYGVSVSQEFKEEEIHGILGQINFNKPLSIDGTPASYIDGEMTLQISEEDEPRKFTVYRCLLIEDKANPGIFYETTDSFLENIKRR